MRSPFLDVWASNFSQMGVLVCGGSAPGGTNFEDQGSAEYKLRLFRASPCYLGYPFHSRLSYAPYLLYQRLRLVQMGPAGEGNFSIFRHAAGSYPQSLPW